MMHQRIQKGMNCKDSHEREATGTETQLTLIRHLHNWQDKRSWNEFYRNYHKLVYSVARKSGLNEAEAWDVVQETFVTIAKQSLKSSYDPMQGSFKSWLLNVTHWRINDQLRKRSPQADEEQLANMPDSRSETFETLWQREWQQNIIRAAISNVRQKVSPRQFQIFDYYVLQGMEPAEVCRKLGVNAAQVYLAKHRIGQQLRQEIAELQDNGD